MCVLGRGRWHKGSRILKAEKAEKLVYEPELSEMLNCGTCLLCVITHTRAHTRRESA